MTYSVAIVALALLVPVAIFRLAQDYVRRSMRSFGKADKVWADLVHSAESLLEDDIPEHLARSIVALMRLAGCGCFVRGVVTAHYLPFLSRTGGGEGAEDAFIEFDALDGEQRERFWALLSAVILYDGFRNPFQGLLFRNMIRTYYRPSPRLSAREKLQAALTAFGVLGRKAAGI